MNKIQYVVVVRICVYSIIPPPVGEAGYSIVRLCTYVRVCVQYVCVCITTLQRCGGIRADQALLYCVPVFNCDVLHLSLTLFALLQY